MVLDLIPYQLSAEIMIFDFFLYFDVVHLMFLDSVLVV